VFALPQNYWSNDQETYANKSLAKVSGDSADTFREHAKTKQEK